MPKRRTEIQAKYDKKNTKHYGFKLNCKNDKELIDALAAADSVQGYIKELIRADIKLSPLLKAIGRKSLSGYELVKVTPETDGNTVRRRAELVKAGDPGDVVVLVEMQDGSIRQDEN